MKAQWGFTNTIIVGFIFLITVLMLTAAWVVRDEQGSGDLIVISSFEACAAAGYPVMESYPRRCAVNGVTFTEVINTNANANSTAVYSNFDLNLTFDYPSAWQPVEEKRLSGGETDQGSMVHVDFTGSKGESDFDTAFQLLYTSIDFAPGREVWLGEVLAAYYAEYGLTQFCDPSSGDGYYQMMRHNQYCTVDTWANGQTAMFFTQINSPEETDIISFVKLFVFETGNETYPLGELVMYLPEANPNNIQAGDTAAVEAVYDSLRNGTADVTTNQRLADFDAVIASLTVTTAIDTSDWLTYENEEYGFSFKYPAEYGEVTVTVSSGTEGSKLRGSFSATDAIIFGGDTKDYSFPSEAGFLDTYGYGKDDDGYFMYLPVAAEEHSIQLIKKVPRTDADGIILTTTMYNIGVSGAIFNLPENIYPGIGFMLRNQDQVSQEEFENVLSTFQFTTPDTSG